MNRQVSVIVPVYNSEKTLPLLFDRLISVLISCCKNFEIVFIEDNGRDNSWQIINDLSRKDSRVRGAKMSRNYGQHNALLCGIRMAKYDVVVTIDDDLQNPPEEIPNLLLKMDEGYDVVYGTPAMEQHGLWRDLASKMTKIALQSTMGAETAKMVSAFRAFKTSIRSAFNNYQSSFVSIDVLLTWGTNRFSAIPVKHEDRKIGTSNYTFRKLITHAFNMMTGFSILPLQLSSLIGFFFTLFGIGVLGYVIVRYLMAGTPVQGFPFLASIIAIFSGAQLFSLGIIGEYLARMHFRIIDRPPYNIGILTSSE